MLVEGKVIKGGNWQAKISIINYEQQSLQKQTVVDSTPDFENKLKALLNDEQTITFAAIFQTPLLQKTFFEKINPLQHHYVIFSTNLDNWWSVQKNGCGITLQKSKKYSEVVEKLRNSPRLSKGGKYPQALEQIQGLHFSMRNFYQWLIESRQLNQKYHLLIKNCQSFAKSFFKQLKSHKTKQEQKKLETDIKDLLKIFAEINIIDFH